MLVDGRRAAEAGDVPEVRWKKIAENVAWSREIALERVQEWQQEAKRLSR